MLPYYLLAYYLPTYYVSQILKRREECVGETNLATGESSYILGLLHQYFGEVQQAQGRMHTALGIYENR